MKLITLENHRRYLEANKDCYTKEIDEIKTGHGRLINSFRPHLKAVGLSYSTKHDTTIRKIIIKLFEAQDNKPFLYVDNSSYLPLCWNEPDANKNGWYVENPKGTIKTITNYIKYVWGHLESKVYGAGDLENFGLFSGRCNQIQTGLNLEELKRIFGGFYKERITQVIKRREELFKTTDWKDMKASLS